VNLFLTPDELAEWTGFKRRAKIIWQLQQFQADGARFKFDLEPATGWPLVLRSVITPPKYEAWKYQVGTVYLIAARGLNRVKIGFTKHLEQRFRSLQLANAADLELVASKTTMRACEAYLHRKYADRRIRGEWYRKCAAIRREFPA
jgi:hypothetical protein